MIYLDANATTPLNPLAKKELIKCLDIKVDTKQAKDYIKKVLHAPHEIIITSGASESNSLIIRSVVDAWWKILNTKPVIISSEVEHSSILETLHELQEGGRIQACLLKCDSAGNISPDDLKNEIKNNKNICLTSIMMANNEVGNFYPVEQFAEICHQNSIPYHSDLTQVIGRYPINITKLGIDCFSASAHKFHGPIGVGFAGINKQLIQGYHLMGQINGKQQKGLRAGTENCANIVAMTIALKQNLVDRKKKNEHLLTMKRFLIEGLPKSTVIHGNQADSLVNTVMFSIVTRKICNIKLKDYFNKQGIIVGIGAACSHDPSHVLKAMGIKTNLCNTCLRISMDDNIKKKHVQTFLRLLKDIVNDPPKEILI